MSDKAFTGLLCLMLGAMNIAIAIGSDKGRLWLVLSGVMIGAGAVRISDWLRKDETP